MGDLTVDPAFGWQYGFPKVWNGEGDIYEWLVFEGYPENLAQEIKENKLWIRYIGNKEDLEKLNE